MLAELSRLTEALQGMLDSPWLWIALFLLAGGGALMPFTPSQTSVVTVGTLIGPDPTLLALLALVAGAGALTGDCLGYGIGRYAGPRAMARLSRGKRSGAYVERAHHLVERHATTLVVAGRFLPGGRVSSMLTTGSVRFPLRRFLLFDAIGAGGWAVYVTTLSALGAVSFSQDPVKGVLLATTLGLLVSAVTGWVRRRRAHTRP